MDKRVQQTCKEMLEQRGFTVNQCYDELIIGDSDDGRVIIFNNRDSVTIAHTKDYIKIMDESGISHAIIVYKNNITPQAKKTLDALPNMEIEVFQEKMLFFNITKHTLVPQHIRLSSLEAAVFKDMYSSKLPVIKQSDPVSRFYNYKVGDVIKIIRRDGIPMFRIVR